VRCCLAEIRESGVDVSSQRGLLTAQCDQFTDDGFQALRRPQGDV
jgi:hypothetical protein